MTTPHLPTMREVERRRWACARIHGDRVAASIVGGELGVSAREARSLADAELEDRRAGYTAQKPEPQEASA